MTDNQPTCATCRFFAPTTPLAGSTPQNGLCRVHAPSANAVKPWPVVQRTDWCGWHPALAIPPEWTMGKPA